MVTEVFAGDGCQFRGSLNGYHSSVRRCQCHRKCAYPKGCSQFKDYLARLFTCFQILVGLYLYFVFRENLISLFISLFRLITFYQFLVGLSSILSVVNYLKSRRMSWPLGLALGAGSIVGAFLAASLTGGKVSFSQYQGWFGVFVLVVGFVLIYELTPKGQAGKKAAKAAAQAFEKTVKEKADISAAGVKIKSFGATKATMSFFGTEFSFNPIAAFCGGVVIAAISAFIGVGGGFLYVPYLTSIVGLPMFVVAGTSALAVLISMITSIMTYINVAGAGMDWAMVGTQLVGVFVGSMIGPRTAKYIPEKWLKLIFIVLASLTLFWLMRDRDHSRDLRRKTR